MNEEHNGETHHRQHKGEKTLTISKLSIWKSTTAILAVLLLVAVFTGGFGLRSNSGESGRSAIEAQQAQPKEDQKTQEKRQAIDIVEIADDDAFLGPRDAKVTVVEFSDFECPYCAAAAGTYQLLIDRFKSQDPTWEPAVPKLKELAKEGKIKFVYRDFPLNIHRNAQKAAEAAECAGEQGKFWEMHDKLFEEGVDGGVQSFKQFAQDLGLNSDEFNECLDSEKMASEVRKDLEDGSSLGISGTPGFIVNRNLISGAQSFAVFEQVIEAELAG